MSEIKKFVCPVCGYIHEGTEAPEKCPQCKCPGSKFKVEGEGENPFAAEHVIGIAKGVDAEVLEGLKAHFEGECTEVGMYLAMSRQADREGYPEIAEAFKRYAFEEAEHASKFGEMLGEVVMPSTKTNLKAASWFSAEDRAGRNFHFGVRELAMGVMANGMALYGGAIAYSSTFFVFSDFMKPAIRLACLQKLPVVYVFTHDSFFVGEDGPTHEPIEQLAMLRTIPDMTVLRPAEAIECAHAWNYAVRANAPVALILTRQDLRPFNSEIAAKVDMTKGAYVVSCEKDFEYILIGTGSELNLALDAAEELRKMGKKVRVVSMPSWELFLKQDKAYRDSVLPPSCKKRVSIEAGSTFGWEKFIGGEGLAIGLDHFGASAPYKVLSEKFGFTVPSVIARMKEHFQF